MKSSAKPAEAPIAAEGGVTVAPGEAPDPYQALDELMVAVEALCPKWPERPPFPSSARFLL
jgi:hypothetical protein